MEKRMKDLTEEEILSEVREELANQGYTDVTDEEIKAAYWKKLEGELSEEDLAEAAGGILVPSFLPRPLPIPQFFAICPRCKKLYCKLFKHKCRVSKK